MSLLANLMTLIDLKKNNTCRWLSILPLVFYLFLACESNPESLSRNPEAEQKSFQFADSDLRISLVASEPDIISPVAMAWAADGALFVAEIPGYPLAKNTGTIKRLTDPDGDGLYHLSSIFAAELNFPTSVMPYKNGILVTDAPYIFFIKDTNGDGVSDSREIVLSGFNTGNEQYRANTLHWGLDNWIYGAGGRAGGSIKFKGTSEEISIDNRDFRFKPDVHSFEAINGMSQFGLAKDNWGNRFITLNHRFARQVILEESHLNRNPSLSTKSIFDTSLTEHDRRVYTLLENLKRFNTDPIGYFTSLAGLTAYRGSLLGEEYEGDFFAGESAQAAVIRRRMKRRGTTFTAVDAEEEAEFLASKDDWFHPVNFANGPDGALYMVDFYRKWVEHPEWANEHLSEGVNWNEGENNGRIWRIVHKDSSWNAKRMLPELDIAGPEELVNQLSDDSGWRRDMAQQILVERQQKEAVPYLEYLFKMGSTFGRIHGLWTLEGLEELTDEQLLEGLKNTSPEVVVQAIKIAEKRLKKAELLSSQIGILALSDNELVRVHAILALGTVELAVIKEILVKTAHQYSDQWTRIALLSSAAPWADEFSRAFLATNASLEKADNHTLDFFKQLGEIVANAKTDKSDSWIASLCKSEKTLKIGQLTFLSGYLGAMSKHGYSLPEFSSTFTKNALALLNDTDNAEFGQIGVDLLAFSKSEKVLKRLVQLAFESKSAKIRMAAIHNIASQNREDIFNEFYDNIQKFDTIWRKELISSSLASIAAVSSLLTAVETGKVHKNEIPEELRHALLSYPDKAIQKKANTILATAVNSDRQAIVDTYLKSMENQNINLAQGEALFSRYCTVCHAINGKGGILAPDLTNIGSRSDEVLLVSILDPSRMVSYELKLHIIETNTGELYSGTISAETVTSITVRQPNGKEHTILKANIKHRAETNQSIMPEGFERMIDEKAMADLIGFLRKPNN